MLEASFTGPHGQDHPPLIDLSPAVPIQDIPPKVKHFGDFTGDTGGDEEETLEMHQKRIEDETFAALFGDPSAPVLTENRDNVNLVRTKSDGQGGTRGVWKGIYGAPEAKTAERKEEISLLDLP